jgi:hypothetical protein
LGTRLEDGRIFAFFMMSSTPFHPASLSPNTVRSVARIVYEEPDLSAAA